MVIDEDDGDLRRLQQTAIEEEHRSYEDRFKELGSNGDFQDPTQGDRLLDGTDSESEVFHQYEDGREDSDSDFVYDGKDMKVVEEDFCDTRLERTAMLKARQGDASEVAPSADGSPSRSADSRNGAWARASARPAHRPFSRLRSLEPDAGLARTTSASSFASDARLHLPPDRSPSASTANGHHASSTPSIAHEAALSNTGLFAWSSLRRITHKIYPAPKRALHPPNTPSPAANTLLGLPTVIAASGVIVIGTAKGWTMVFDYASNLKCVLGSDMIVTEAGSVSSLAISHDHTFVAVGHNMGHIYLYDLAKPNMPARSVPPTNIRLVQAGRAEGHLTGQKIIHLGFIGHRHTAIVSADDTGLAFYHRLGQVLGLASTDVIRILGNYPDGPRLSAPPSALVHQRQHPTYNHARASSDLSLTSASAPQARNSARRPIHIFGCAPLPLGPAPHPTDSHSLVALLTPAKLIIIGLKPKARTWWRSMRDIVSTDELDHGASLCWFPSTPTPERTKPNCIDPLLAFAWGRQIRFVTVMADVSSGESHRHLGGTELDGGLLEGLNRRLAINAKVPDLRFVEGKRWTCESTIEAIQWLNWRIICVLTSTHLEIIDTQIWQRTGIDRMDVRSIVRLNSFWQTFNPPSPESERRTRPGGGHDGGWSLMGSFRAYKGKIFLLTTHDLRLGIVVSWADQILGLVDSGALTEAIELTTGYWFGRAELETIGLPSEPRARHLIVGPKLKEIMQASVEYVFSDRRMADETHFDPLGRGVDRTELFEGLVRSCARACIAMEELSFLFDELFERYHQHGIQSIFLDQITPFVLSSEIIWLPTAIVQQLVSLHETRRSFDTLEAIVCHVQPSCLDLNQALAICSREGLYDGLVYIYTEAMGDFVGPVVESVYLIRAIFQDRESRAEDGESDFVSDMRDREAKAYKLYAYLSHLLLGCAYPSKKAYDIEIGSSARRSIYQFLFSGHSVRWPVPGGKLILTTPDDREPTYPYLRLLLKFDAEAFLDTLDEAFEDSWLDDQVRGRDRQWMVNVLLDVIGISSSESESEYHNAFSTTDKTFLCIFVARNLPKYVQFLSFPLNTLQDILISLSSNIEKVDIRKADRELAVEFLLSVYSPNELGQEAERNLLQRFEEAGFWCVLGGLYGARGEWDRVAESCLKGSDGIEIFGTLPEILKAVSGPGQDVMASRVDDVLLGAADTLVRTSVPLTASLIDTLRPGLHGRMLEALEGMEVVQFAYLHSLLEAEPPSEHLDQSARLRYVRLLCEREPGAVLSFLRRTPLEPSEALYETLRAHGLAQALVWQLAQAGSGRRALRELKAAIEGLKDPEILDELAQVGIEICKSFSDEQAWAELIEAIMSSSRSSERDILPKLVSAMISQGNISTSALLRRLPSAPRALVMAMTDGYAFEASVLDISLKLIDRDLSEHSTTLLRVREHGTKSGQANCMYCGRSIFGIGRIGVTRDRMKKDSDEVIERLGVPLRAIGRRKSLKGKEVEPSISGQGEFFVEDVEEEDKEGTGRGGGGGGKADGSIINTSLGVVSEMDEQQKITKRLSIGHDGAGAANGGYDHHHHHQVRRPNAQMSSLVSRNGKSGVGSDSEGNYGVMVNSQGIVLHQNCWNIWKGEHRDNDNENRDVFFNNNNGN